MQPDRLRAFIIANTVVASPPLVPELALHLATEVVPLWSATEAFLAELAVPPPFWAFAWPGGQALARYVLDHQGDFAGRTVLDFAAGCGIAAIAAAMAGARAMANDVDALALAATALNASLNGAAVAMDHSDRVGWAEQSWDIILAGDVFYEQPLAGRIAAWLRAQAALGTTILVADPGRTYALAEGLQRLAVYTVPTSLELEDRTERQTWVARLIPGDSGKCSAPGQARLLRQQVWAGTKAAD
jgi:predicted nicotinamide N-methyase